MTEPGRVGRWWVAAALATLWVLEAGQEAVRLQIPATRTHNGQGAAVTSLFALGLAVLTAQLGRAVVRRLRRLQQPDWPASDDQRDTLKEQDWLTQHRPLPL
jgi:hypothetical protein